MPTKVNRKIKPDGELIPYFEVLEDLEFTPITDDFKVLPAFSSFRGKRITILHPGDGITCSCCKKTKRLSFYTKLNTRSRKDYDCVCVVCRGEAKTLELNRKADQRRTLRFEKEAKARNIKKASIQKRSDKLKVERDLERKVAAQKTKQLAIDKVYEADKRKLNSAELELAQRTLIRRKLLPFIQKFNKNYKTGWVHQDICERLDKFVKAVANQESPRLMLFMPPRHGKSEIASKNLPAHILGNHPTWEIISASYAVSLPMGFSKKIHATMADPYYKILFPKTRLHPKAQATEEWMTTAEGAYVAAGVGGGITGKGAHVLIIDDPVKDAQEADSQGQRDTVWNWWGSTAKTRLAPGGGVLIIQTRWHDDDLSGRLLAKMKEDKQEITELIFDAELRMSQAEEGSEQYLALIAERDSYVAELAEIDDWEVVQYPAIATADEYIHADGKITNEDAPNARRVRHKGEELHTARYPLSRLRNMKRSMQPRHWSALYQQNPVPDEGMYFTKSMLRYSPSLASPTQCKLFSAWDLAIGERQSNDYTVGVVGGLDWMGQLNIVEVLRFRGNSHVIADTILTTYQKYPTIQQIGMEQGTIQMAIMPTLNSLMRKRKLYPSLSDELKPINDKQARARPLQGLMQQGRVILPSNQPWVEDAVMELLRFPGGLHDDIVDALAWLAHMTIAAKPPAKPGTEKHKSWKDRMNRMMMGNSQLGPMGA